MKESAVILVKEIEEFLEFYKGYMKPFNDIQYRKAKVIELLTRAKEELTNG